MARDLVFSWIAYDNHGEVLGYLINKPEGNGLVTVHSPSGKLVFVSSKQIGRYEIYNLQALLRHQEEVEKRKKDV